MGAVHRYCRITLQSMSRPMDLFSILLSGFRTRRSGTQRAVYDFSDTSFKQALCRARTFGFVHEVEKMHSMGPALGGSLKNAIVVGEDGVVNDEGLALPRRVCAP